MSSSKLSHSLLTKESTGPASLWLLCSVQAELFPNSSAEPRERSSSSSSSSEEIMLLCIRRKGCINGKRMTKKKKKLDEQLILFWSFQEGSIQPPPILEEVSEPSTAKCGPDQLLWFKLMLQERSHGAGRNWGLTDANRDWEKIFVLKPGLKEAMAQELFPGNSAWMT